MSESLTDKKMGRPKGVEKKELRERIPAQTHATVYAKYRRSFITEQVNILFEALAKGRTIEWDGAGDVDVKEK